MGVTNHDYFTKNCSIHTFFSGFCYRCMGAGRVSVVWMKVHTCATHCGAAPERARGLAASSTSILQPYLTVTILQPIFPIPTRYIPPQVPDKSQVNALLVLRHPSTSVLPLRSATVMRVPTAISGDP